MTQFSFNKSLISYALTLHSAVPRPTTCEVLGGIRDKKICLKSLSVQ